MLKLLSISGPIWAFLSIAEHLLGCLAEILGWDARWRSLDGLGLESLESCSLLNSPPLYRAYLLGVSYLSLEIIYDYNNIHRTLKKLLSNLQSYDLIGSVCNNLEKNQKMTKHLY